MKACAQCSAVGRQWKHWLGPSAKRSSGHWGCFEGGCSAWPSPHPISPQCLGCEVSKFVLTLMYTK